LVFAVNLKMFKKEVVGVDYLTRWHLLKNNRFLNIYLHKFEGDDAPFAHDHPWPSMSLCLAGKVREFYRDDDTVTSTRRALFNVRLIGRGRLIYRRALFAHRLEVVDGPVWTLFITGPKVRDWGFYTPSGWRVWVDNEDAEFERDPGEDLHSIGEILEGEG